MEAIMVTGGCGFIGSHLVDALLQKGHSVIVVDDFSEGRPENLPESPRLSIYRRSILDDNCDLLAGVGTVYHLAALPRPQYSVVEPERTHQVNAGGTLKVLLACRDAGVRRVVFASSACVYGRDAELPSCENDLPRPMTPYGAQKLIGETYCKLSSDLYGLETVSLRLFNVYGPRQNPSGEYASLIPKFIKLISSGERPTIYGDGSQARDFVHVSDVVRAFLLAAEKLVAGRVFNIGYGDNCPVYDVFQMICKALGKEVEPLYGPAQVEPQATLASRQWAKHFLGWTPEIELEEGVRMMAEQMMEHAYGR